MTRRSRVASWALILSILLAVGLFFTAWATGDMSGRPRHYVDAVRGKRMILTIDDGPDPRFTPEILDILKEYKAKATFFVVGEAVREHPDLIRRIVAEGHEVANHTMTHPHLEKMPRAAVEKEILGAQRLLRDATGVEPAYFRPPRGNTSETVESVLSTTKLQTVYWTVGLESRKAPDPSAMAERVMEKLRPGTIVLMHDGRLDRSKSVKALRILLDRAESERYKTISLRQAKAIPGAKIKAMTPLDEYFW